MFGNSKWLDQGGHAERRMGDKARMVGGGIIKLRAYTLEKSYRYKVFELVLRKKSK